MVCFIAMYVLFDCWMPCSSSIAERAIDKIAKLVKAETGIMPARDLACLSELTLNVELLDADKPTSAENEFHNVTMGSDGRAVLRNARYKTRVRASASVRPRMNC